MEILDNIDFKHQTDEESSRLIRQRQELKQAYKHSIISCHYCSRRTGNRVYIASDGYWCCMRCYKRRIEPKLIKKQQLLQELELTTDQILVYFYLLGGVYEGKVFNTRDIFADMDISSRVDFLAELEDTIEDGPFGYSREILTAMGISRQQQDILLELIELYVCHCDAEIFLIGPRKLLDFIMSSRK
jgi:hypothetical protein